MKKEFILLAIQPGANLRELFRRYGISAPCGYKWLRAYQEKGFAGLEQKSRRPRSHPDEIGPQMRAQILSLRDKQPAWGGRKLKRRLESWEFKGCRRRARSPKSYVATGGSTWTIPALRGLGNALSTLHPMSCGKWTLRA
jgi:transposase-like protein